MLGINVAGAQVLYSTAGHIYFENFDSFSPLPPSPMSATRPWTERRACWGGICNGGNNTIDSVSFPVKAGSTSGGTFTITAPPVPPTVFGTKVAGMIFPAGAQ